MERKERIVLLAILGIALVAWAGRKAFVRHKTWLIGPAPAFMGEALQTEPLTFVFEDLIGNDPQREVESRAFIEGPALYETDPPKTLSPIDFDGDGFTDTVTLVRRRDRTWELDELNSYARVLVRSGHDGGTLLDVPIRMPFPQTRVHLVGDVSGDGIDDLAMSHGYTVQVWFGGP